jgi:hypothetical protein
VEKVLPNLVTLAAVRLAHMLNLRRKEINFHPNLISMNCEIGLKLLCVEFCGLTEAVDYKLILKARLSYTTFCLKWHLSKWGDSATRADKLILSAQCSRHKNKKATSVRLTISLMK